MTLNAESERVLGKIRFFRKAAVWPLEFPVDADGWLANFQPGEKDAAIALLDAFSYFAPELSKKILAAAFDRLSTRVAPLHVPASVRLAEWERFRSRAIITYPTDERPGATDSGRTYLRRARAVLGLDESQIVDPPDAIDRAEADPSIPIVFVDDFAGSGSQFLRTWRRGYPVGAPRQSFEALAASRFIAYIPVLCSSMAADNISYFAPEVILEPGHVLGREYSVFAPNSRLWQTREQQAQAIQVIRSASERVGIPMGDGATPNDWCGFGGLGLTIAIDDTIPDACITLLYWDKNGWRPLFRRP